MKNKLIETLRKRKVIHEEAQAKFKELDEILFEELEKLDFHNLCEIFLLANPFIIDLGINEGDRIPYPLSPHTKRAKSVTYKKICGYNVIHLVTSTSTDKLAFAESPKLTKGAGFRIFTRREMIRYIINRNGGNLIK